MTNFNEPSSSATSECLSGADSKNSTESPSELEGIDEQALAALEKEIAMFQAQEPAKEVASKHLAKFGGFYMVLLIVCFIYASTALPAEKIAVVAGLITMVATGLITILKGITDTGEKNPMVKIVHELVERLDKEPEDFLVNVQDGKVNITRRSDQQKTESDVESKGK